MNFNNKDVTNAMTEVISECNNYSTRGVQDERHSYFGNRNGYRITNDVICRINDAIKIACKVMGNKDDEFLTYVVGKMLVMRSLTSDSKYIRNSNILSFENLYSRVKSNSVEERLKVILTTCDKEEVVTPPIDYELRKDNENWHNTNFYNDELISYS